jgi:enamine deaminase RidA (YjgF/YER057c/UK114 family)
LLGVAGVELTDIVRLNMFFLGEQDISTDFHAVMKVWQEFAPNANPTMTAVKAFELSSPGVEFMADCVAIKN